MDYYQKLIDRLDDLPTLPKIYTALLRVMNDPNTSVDEVSSLISQDQSATVQVLKTVNSPFFGLQAEIDSVKNAIIHLGFNEIKNLVFALSMIKTFSEKDSSTAFNVRELWKHSLAVGVGTRLIGMSVGVKNKENYFLSGIVHDIGKLFFLQYFEEDYKDTVEEAIEKHIPIEEAEFDMFGISHTIIGDLLAEKWKLPQSIRVPIKYHNVGLIEDKFDIQVACVHVANIMARALELGHPGDNMVHKPNALIWDKLNLGKNALTDMSKHLQRDYENAAQILL